MTSFTSPEARWAAVSSRNPLASSAFIYSVTTTKIYCRPTCPSRLARRSNVIFHNSPAEAEIAGFRACKRCLPNAIDEDRDPQTSAVRRACDLVGSEDVRGVKWTVKALGAEVGMTESHFCRVFRKVMGMTVGEYRASLFSGGIACNAATGQAYAYLNEQMTQPENHDPFLLMDYLDSSEFFQTWEVSYNSKDSNNEIWTPETLSIDNILFADKAVAPDYDGLSIDWDGITNI